MDSCSSDAYYLGRNSIEPALGKQANLSHGELSMKNRSTALLLLAGLTALGPTLAQAEIPLILLTSETAQTEPIWVAADAVLSADGQVDPKLFNEDDARLIQNFIETPGDGSGCVLVENFYAGSVNSKDRSTLEKAAQSSKVILTGKVREIGFGFRGPTPGQLVEVEPERFLFGRLPTQPYYFFIPVGRFAVGQAEICKTDTRWTELPKVDDEVVLLIPRLTGTVEQPELLPGDSFLYLDQPESLVVIRQDGRAAAATADRRTPFMEARTKDDVLQEIRRALQGL